MTRMTRRRFLQGSLRGALGSAMGSGLALGLGAGSSSVLGCGWAPGGAVSEEALDIHRRSIVFDLHIDTLLWQRLFGYDPLKRHENRLPLQPFGFHFDLPRAREGGLDGAVMGIVVNPAEVRDDQCTEGHHVVSHPAPEQEAKDRGQQHQEEPLIGCHAADANTGSTHDPPAILRNHEGAY